MSKPHTIPLKLPKSSERARRTSGVVQKRAEQQNQQFEHELFGSDEPTDPHAFDPGEYAKLSNGEGDYRWHDEDTDLNRPLEQSGERRKIAACETKRLAAPDSKQHFPLPQAPPRALLHDRHTQTDTQLTPAHHSDIDTEPKILIEPLHQAHAAPGPGPSSRIWIATALGFILGVSVTLTIAWLLQAL